MSEYFIPAGPGEAEFTEKRSRFLGHIRPVESEEEARAFISQVKKEHYDARHNCWCYLLHGGVERYSDDGEPQGTAGLPMLEVFRREGVTDMVCVVTRYFGGVLLGAAGIAVVRPWVEAELPCSYAMAERLKGEIAAMGGQVAGMDYAAGVTIRALVPREGFPAFRERIFDVSSGSVTPRAVGETHRAVRIK